MTYGLSGGALAVQPCTATALSARAHATEQEQSVEIDLRAAIAVVAASLQIWDCRGMMRPKGWLRQAGTPANGAVRVWHTFMCCASPAQDEHVLTRALGREQRQLSMLRTQLGQMLFKMDNLPVSLSTIACQSGRRCCVCSWGRCWTCQWGCPLSQAHVTHACRQPISVAVSAVVHQGLKSMWSPRCCSQDIASCCLLLHVLS